MSVPTTSYNPNIPQSTDLLSNSQLSILNNFGAIQTLVDVDHVDFANAAGGQHNKVSLVVQSPAPTFAAGQVGLYSFADSASGQNELYVNKTNNSGVVQIAATESILGTTNPTPGTFGSTGWSMRPSGIKLVWGTAVASAAGAQTITLTGNQAFATTILSVQLTVIGTSTWNVMGNIRAVSFPSANSFVVVSTNPANGNFAANNFMYLAIGY